MAGHTLISELRQRIKDTRFSIRGLSVVVSDSAVTSALAEVTNGRLIVTVSGGTTPSIDFDLTNVRLNTVGKLFDVISRATGYTAHLDEDAETDHLSVDFASAGPIDIRANGLELRHRLFSDSELETILGQAIQRHNPSFTLLTLPAQEHIFVLQLAHAIVLREQAADAAKRKGLDQTVKDLLRIADSYEHAYKEDRARLTRALVSPKEADPNTMGSGDIVIGTAFRKSLRTGYRAPISQSLSPSSAVLETPDVMGDVEDDAVRIRWTRNRDNNFYSYELWMDTRPEVRRGSEGLEVTEGPVGFVDTPERAYARQSNTSKMVFRSFGANASTVPGFSVFVEEFGQAGTSFYVTKLESESDYYFRLYIRDQNNETIPSNVVRLTTKPLRVRFATTNFSNKLNGPAGTVVTLNFDPTKGVITADHVFRIGGKIAALTLLTSYSASFVVPTFQNIGNKDFSIQSPTGLVDVKPFVFNVT